MSRNESPEGSPESIAASASEAIAAAASDATAAEALAGVAAEQAVAVAFDAARYFDAAVAARYDQGIRLSCPAYDGLQAMLAPLLRLLSPTAHVLCAGVGTGTEIITLGSRFPQWTFTAVDISADMLAVCEGRLREAGLLERVRLVHGEVDALADDASFDAATSIFVGHFIADTGRKQAYFQSIARRLRPQAPLIVSDLHGRRGSPEFVELMKAWLLYYVSHGTTREKLTADLELILRDMSFVPEEELLALLEGVGITGTVRFFQSFLFGGWIGLRAGA